jgi:hypothetical protein
MAHVAVQEAQGGKAADRMENVGDERYRAQDALTP